MTATINLAANVDKSSFMLGYAFAWIDPDRFSSSFNTDPISAVKEWLKGMVSVGQNLSSLGGNADAYHLLVGFTPEKELTELMKLELQVLEEGVRDGGNPDRVEKILIKKAKTLGRAISEILAEENREKILNSLLFSDPQETVVAASVIEPAAAVTQEPESEPDPAKEVPPKSKKTKEQEELDRLAFLWITGQYY